MKIDYNFIAYCFQRYYNCLMQELGRDDYIPHGRNHAYVIGKPLNKESNCFIISGHFLISIWFDPIEREIYGELRHSADYNIHASGIHSMRNMKAASVLVEYPLIAHLSKGEITPARIENWLASARHKSTKLAWGE